MSTKVEWWTIGLAIDKVDFEKAEPARSLCDRILEFLTRNNDKAYSEDEISSEILRTDPIVKTLTIVGRQAVVLAALENLVRDGTATARLRNATTYYMARDLARDLMRKPDLK